MPPSCSGTPRFSSRVPARASRRSTTRDGDPDASSIAAYYWWVFPNLMLNFYPWGLSMNLVHPEAIDRTRIAFRSYVWDASKLDDGAGGALDRVEAEDEAIVEAVQRGVRSRFYSRGRYSPTREQGVHHFHRLLGEFLADHDVGCDGCDSFVAGYTLTREALP